MFRTVQVVVAQEATHKKTSQMVFSVSRFIATFEQWVSRPSVCGLFSIKSITNWKFQGVAEQNSTSSALQLQITVSGTKSLINTSLLQNKTGDLS
jgi:hypothetical protein